jgi:hypothetical protein
VWNALIFYALNDCYRGVLTEVKGRKADALQQKE